VNNKPCKEGEADNEGRSEYLLRGFTKDVMSPEGSNSKEVWSGMSYDPYGNMNGYAKDVVDFQGLPVVQTWTGAYDLYDQVNNYLQVTTDSFGHSQREGMADISYNKVNDMIGYIKTLTENGKRR